MNAQVDEFCLIWFDTHQTWFVMLPKMALLPDGYPSMGAALGAALDHIGAGEADFDCDEDTGRFYRYVRTEEIY